MSKILIYKHKKILEIEEIGVYFVSNEMLHNILSTGKFNGMNLIEVLPLTNEKVIGTYTPTIQHKDLDHIFRQI